MTKILHNEFERCVVLADLLGESSRVTFTATPQELKALTQRLAVREVRSLRIDVDFIPKKVLKRVDVQARLKAVLQQECVVTLEPIKSVINETIPLILSGKENHLSDSDAILYEGPEVITCKPHEPIDIGEVFVQYLCLVMDPFPRVFPATE